MDLNTPPEQQSTTIVAKNPPKRKKGPWLLIWLSLTAVATISATAGAMLAVSVSDLTSSSETTIPDTPKPEILETKRFALPELTRPVNILVLGTKVLTSDLDNRTEDDQGYHAVVDSFKGLADTMLLLRFDPKNGKLTVLSVPRDTRARIPGHGIDKINVANYYGGAELAAETIGELLGGVPVDRVVRVNVLGVEKIIDALGGVTVYVPKDMKYIDESQHLYINLKQGKQHLDGNKAMQFLRFRYDRLGDIGRVQRQQILMRSLVEQVLKPSSLLRIPKIKSIVQANVETNLEGEELLALAGFGAKIERSKIQMLMLPGYFSGDGRGKEEVSYWLPNTRRINLMMAQHFDMGELEAEALNPAYVRVAIQDSIGDKEAVAAMSRYLREVGYTRVFVTEDWREPLKTTRIVAQHGDNITGASLRSALGVGEVRVESTGSLGSDLTIQIGEDWRLQQFSE